MALRLSKTIMVAAIAVFAALVTFGNLTDYETNLAFVQHVLREDTIFPTSHIHYRAISSPEFQQALYAAIIATEAMVALFCGAGAWRLFRLRSAPAASFNRGKALSVAGLTLGFLLWQLGFMTIGGEWFGMWQSKAWNGVESAFRFTMVIVGVLIFLALPDGEDEPL